MAQHDFVINNQGFPAFRSDLNDFLNAVRTSHSGTSTPSGAVAGTIWLDTTSATTPTLKYYDGTDNISLATIDHVGNTVNWLDSTVSITGLSTTATGTVLTLTDSASTSTVNLIIDNQKEIRFRETTANGTNYVALKAPASVSADLTFTLPATDGTNGQVLTTNGSGVLSFATPASGIAWQSSVKTSGFTATAGEGYFCNTTSAGFTVTLPATPTAGQQIALVDYAGTFDTNALTISPNGNKIEGVTDNLILSGEREGATLVYIDSTQGWLATSGINEGTDALSSAPYSIDFLVVAGGGGGGSDEGGGGGGAGGYRTSTQTVNSATVITVTVGDGGVGGVDGANDIFVSTSTSGSNSSISGSGLSTITSAGGGRGGNGLPGAPTTGGSGGGGGSESSQSGSAGNTPSTSPSQGNSGGNGVSNYGGAGGGGATASGANAPDGNNGGVGGAGTASSITGSSITRAGGGGGGTSQSGPGSAGAGGAGGGGSGTRNGNGVAGTANTGGGGGGSGRTTGVTNNSGGAGGKGVVILSMPDASYSGTTTGSPTVATGVSGKTVLTFNGSGSYTA
jgi:hypothetical protein